VREIAVFGGTVHSALFRRPHWTREDNQG